MLRRKNVLAAALSCAVLFAVFAAEPVLGNFEETSPETGVEYAERSATGLDIPNAAFEEFQQQVKAELEQQLEGQQWPSEPGSEDLLVMHRADMTAEQPVPFETRSAEFDVEGSAHLALAGELEQAPDEPTGSSRKLAQDEAQSDDVLSNCAIYSNEVNDYVNQGWRVKYYQYATPEKCPEHCKVDYRGPTDGVYSLQCNPAKCFCAFINGDKQYKNVVMKDSGALSIVDAMPADCPREECVGGGYEFCEPGSDCSASI